MTRYIDADECLNELKDHATACKMPNMWYTGIRFAEHHINAAPTVDAIPIEYMQSQVDCGKWQEIIKRWKEHDN